MRAKDDYLELQVFVCCFEIFFYDLEATVAEEVDWCEFPEDFVDDFENIKQEIFVDKLLAQKKSQQLGLLKQLSEQFLEAVFFDSTALNP